MNFTCTITPDALTLNITEQGTYKPWWKDIRLEIYGWQPHQNTAVLEGSSVPLHADRTADATIVTLPETNRGISLRVE